MNIFMNMLSFLMVFNLAATLLAGFCLDCKDWIKERKHNNKKHKNN